MLLCQLLSYYLTDNFNRVKLNIVSGEEGSDYINASFINVSCLHNCLQDDNKTIIHYSLIFIRGS